MEDLKPRITGEMQSKGYLGLQGEDAIHVRTVSYFLEYVGTLMAAKHLNEDLVILEIGRPVIELWRTLGGFVQVDRANRNYSGYQKGFEHFASRSQERYAKVVGTVKFADYQHGLNSVP